MVNFAPNSPLVVSLQLTVREPFMQLAPGPAARERAPCPDCGNRVVRSSGCMFCPSCGWAACG